MGQTRVMCQQLTFTAPFPSRRSRLFSAIQPSRREPLFLPRCGHCLRQATEPQGGGKRGHLPQGLQLPLVPRPHWRQRRRLLRLDLRE
jgi:hypothetical protein